MAGDHEPADGLEVSRSQRIDALSDTLVLGDYVACTCEKDRVGECRQIIDGGEAEWTDHLFGRLTGRHPFRVRAPGNCAMGDVLDHDLGAIGYGDRFDGQIVAVEEHRMAIEAVERGHLVEDAGGHPGRRPLSPLAEKGHLEPRMAGSGAEGESEGDAEGARRGESGPDRHRRFDRPC